MHFFDTNKTLGLAVFAPDILSPDDACAGTDLDACHPSDRLNRCLSNKIIMKGLRGRVIKNQSRLAALLGGQTRILGETSDKNSLVFVLGFFFALLSSRLFFEDMWCLNTYNRMDC